jgi:hypothetical protein
MRFAANSKVHLQQTVRYICSKSKIRFYIE